MQIIRGIYYSLAVWNHLVIVLKNVGMNQSCLLVQSHLDHLMAEWFWISDLTFLYLSLVIYVLGVVSYLKVIFWVVGFFVVVVLFLVMIK